MPGAAMQPGHGGAGQPRSGRVRSGRVMAGRVMAEAGMTTAEYAVGTVAACGFAGVLYKLLTSDAVVSMLTGIVRRALTIGF
ncbi:MAG: hypothetical protein QOI54_51 [Actinomycetota bacterium]|nr:hypothetical protein [Actinomycetota bacterium]